MNREEVKDLYCNRKVVKNIIAAGIENVILDINAIFDCNLNKIEYKVSYFDRETEECDTYMYDNIFDAIDKFFDLKEDIQGISAIVKKDSIIC